MHASAFDMQGDWIRKDGSINGVVRIQQIRRDRLGPTLSIKRVVNTQITGRIPVTISLEVTTRIPG
jgi:hypothetical protein